MTTYSGQVQGLSNWQDVPQDAFRANRGAASHPMSRRCAEGCEYQAAMIKAEVIKAFFDFTCEHAPAHKLRIEGREF